MYGGSAPELLYIAHWCPPLWSGIYHQTTAMGKILFTFSEVEFIGLGYCNE